MILKKSKLYSEGVIDIENRKINIKKIIKRPGSYKIKSN